MILHAICSQKGWLKLVVFSKSKAPLIPNIYSLPDPIFFLPNRRVYVDPVTLVIQVIISLFLFVSYFSTRARLAVRKILQFG